MVNAAVVGNTYSFTITAINQYTRDSNGPVSNSDFTAYFQIHVFNVTPSDRYEYTFKGYHQSEHFPADVNDSVDFQNNKVYFVIMNTDANSNNRSEIASIRIYPYWPNDPGRDIFVNPTWTTHETDWNSAISDAEDNPSVASISNSAIDGSFSFSIVVNMEGGAFVGPDYQSLNGTQTFNYASSYDEDGILLSWSYSYTLQMQNENYTSTSYYSNTIVRGTSPIGGAGSDVGGYLLVGGASFIVALVLGAYLGKKFFS